jgi:8-oxo-dGTP pyrophosphatase MutT (NUDIX family)
MTQLRRRPLVRYCRFRTGPVVTLAGMTPRPLVQLLTSHRPAGPVERADVERLLELLHDVEDPWTQELSLHVTGSALVVHPPTKRVLLRWHARQEAWLQVGGHGDPGESDPLQVALREGEEETGLADLRPWPDGALVHAVIVSVVAKGESAAHEHADLRFVLATSEPDAIRPEKPGAELLWLTVAQALEMTAEDNLRETIRRVGVLLDAFA